MRCILCSEEASLNWDGYNLCAKHYVKGRKSPIEHIGDFVDAELGLKAKDIRPKKSKQDVECIYEEDCIGKTRLLCFSCELNKKAKKDYYQQKRRVP